jgi:hypothetical protein
MKEIEIEETWNMIETEIIGIEIIEIIEIEISTIIKIETMADIEIKTIIIPGVIKIKIIKECITKKEMNIGIWDIKTIIKIEMGDIEIMEIIEIIIEI